MNRDILVKRFHNILCGYLYCNTALARAIKPINLHELHEHRIDDVLSRRRVKDALISLSVSPMSQGSVELPLMR